LNFAVNRITSPRLRRLFTFGADGEQLFQVTIEDPEDRYQPQCTHDVIDGLVEHKLELDGQLFVLTCYVSATGESPTWAAGLLRPVSRSFPIPAGSRSRVASVGDRTRRGA